MHHPFRDKEPLFLDIIPVVEAWGDSSGQL